MKKIIYFVIIMFISVSSYALREGIEKHIEGNKWLACELERNGMYLRTYYHLFAPNGDFVPLDYPENDMKYYKLNVETGEYERVENIKAEYILYGTVDPETLRRFDLNCDRFGDCGRYVYVFDIKTGDLVGKLDCGGKWLADYASVDHKIRKVFVSCYIGGCYNDISNPEPCRWKKVVFDADTLKKAWESETWLDACRGERYEGKEKGTLYCKSSKGNKMLKVRVDYDKGKWEVVKELDVPSVWQIKNGVGMRVAERLEDEEGKVYTSKEIKEIIDYAERKLKKPIFEKYTVYLYDMETGALIKKVSYPEKALYTESRLINVTLMPNGKRFYGIFQREPSYKKVKVDNKDSKYECSSTLVYINSDGKVKLVDNKGSKYKSCSSSSSEYNFIFVDSKGTKFKWVWASGKRWEKLWVVDIEKNINKLYDINIGWETVKKEPKVVHFCPDSSCVVYRAGDELIWIDLDKGKITKRIKIKYPEECGK